MNSNQTKNPNLLGTIFLGIAAAIMVLVGVVTNFIGFERIYLTYIVASIFIVLGIAMIVKYFATGAFKSMHDYSFSIGAVIVVIGGTVLARASLIVEFLYLLVGVIVLTAGTVVLQQSIQLKLLKQVTWIADIILAIAIIVAAVLVLSNAAELVTKVENFEYIVLMVTGVLMLASLVMTFIGNKLYTKAVIADKTAIDVEPIAAEDAAGNVATQED